MRINRHYENENIENLHTWFSSRLTRSLLSSPSLRPKILPAVFETEDPCGVLVAGVEKGTKLFFDGFGVSSLTSIPRTFNS